MCKCNVFRPKVSSFTLFLWRIVNHLVGDVGEHLPWFWSGKPDIV